MGIVLDSDFHNGVVEVRRVNSRLIVVKVAWRGLIFNLVSAYGPQAGLDEVAKWEFWEEFDLLLLGIQ